MQVLCTYIIIKAIKSKTRINQPQIEPIFKMRFLDQENNTEVMIFH
jgi:hypothetical protein